MSDIRDIHSRFFQDQKQTKIDTLKHPISFTIIFAIDRPNQNNTGFPKYTKMACYCANYYGSVNCHNTVSMFGDRCALCVSNNVTSAGASSNGYGQADQQWSENVRREQMRREEEKSRRERVSRTTSGRIR